MKREYFRPVALIAGAVAASAGLFLGLVHADDARCSKDSVSSTLKSAYQTALNASNALKNSARSEGDFTAYNTAAASLKSLTLSDDEKGKTDNRDCVIAIGDNTSQAAGFAINSFPGSEVAADAQAINNAISRLSVDMATKIGDVGSKLPTATNANSDALLAQLEAARAAYDQRTLALTSILLANSDKGDVKDLDAASKEFLDEFYGPDGPLGPLQDIANKLQLTPDQCAALTAKYGSKPVAALLTDLLNSKNTATQTYRDAVDAAKTKLAQAIADADKAQASTVQCTPQVPPPGIPPPGVPPVPGQPPVPGGAPPPGTPVPPTPVPVPAGTQTIDQSMACEIQRAQDDYAAKVKAALGVVATAKKGATAGAQAQAEQMILQARAEYDAAIKAIQDKYAGVKKTHDDLVAQARLDYDKAVEDAAKAMAATIKDVVVGIGEVNNSLAAGQTGSCIGTITGTSSTSTTTTPSTSTGPTVTPAQPGQ